MTKLYQLKYGWPEYLKFRTRVGNFLLSLYVCNAFQSGEEGEGREEEREERDQC